MIAWRPLAILIGCVLFLALLVVGSGMMTGLALPIYCGATVVLLHRFDATAVLQAIEACKVSWWYTRAPSLPSTLACDDAASYDLSSLRTTVGTERRSGMRQRTRLVPVSAKVWVSRRTRWKRRAPSCTNRISTPSPPSSRSSCRSP